MRDIRLLIPAVGDKAAIEIDNQWLSPVWIENFANNDGFDSALLMCEFFVTKYATKAPWSGDLMDFEGLLIQWDQTEY